LERWLVSWETSSEGSSYGSKISWIVPVTDMGSVTVCASVSLNVALYDSLEETGRVSWVVLQLLWQDTRTLRS
jgi:hypothetical protein